MSIALLRETMSFLMASSLTSFAIVLRSDFDFEDFGLIS